MFQTTTINTTIQATIAAGTSCTVDVTAMFGSYSGNTISSLINTTSEGTYTQLKCKINEHLSQLQLVVLECLLTHQWRAGLCLCSGGQYPALTREDPSLDTNCAIAMAPPL